MPCSGQQGKGDVVSIAIGFFLVVVALAQLLGVLEEGDFASISDSV